MSLAELLTILIMLHTILMAEKNVLFEWPICVTCLTFMKEIF